MLPKFNLLDRVRFVLGNNLNATPRRLSNEEVEATIVAINFSSAFQYLVVFDPGTFINFSAYSLIYNHGILNADRIKSYIIKWDSAQLSEYYGLYHIWIWEHHCSLVTTGRCENCDGKIALGQKMCFVCEKGL